jgi:hypothetical protein
MPPKSPAKKHRMSSICFVVAFVVVAGGDRVVDTVDISVDRGGAGASPLHLDVSIRYISAFGQNVGENDVLSERRSATLYCTRRTAFVAVVAQQCVYMLVIPYKELGTDHKLDRIKIKHTKMRKRERK